MLEGGPQALSGLRLAAPSQMTLYLTFPVAMFWIANQAEWFEGSVIQRKVGAGSARGGVYGLGAQGRRCLRPGAHLPWAWAREAPGSPVALPPQRELWPPEKEDQVRDTPFPPAGQGAWLPATGMGREQTTTWFPCRPLPTRRSGPTWTCV